MRMNRSEFFIRKDFAFYDSGVAPIVGLPVVYLYEVLRRFIWRGSANCALASSLARDGKVFARISQHSLAGALGTVRRQTVNEHMNVLKKLGWVEVYRDRKNETTCYVLGQLVIDGKDRKHEVLFADAWCQDVWSWLEETSEKEFGTKLVLDADSVETQVLARPVHTLSWDWRERLVRQFMDAPESQEPEDDHVVPDLDSSVENCAPVQVRQGGPGLSALPDKGEGGMSATADIRSREASEELEKTEIEMPGRSLRERPLLKTTEFSQESEETGPRVRGLSHLAKPSKFGGPRPVGEVSVARAVPVPRMPQDTPESSPAAQDRFERLTAIVALATEQGKASRTTQMAQDAKKAQRMANLGGAPVPLGIRRELQQIESSWTSMMQARFPGVKLAAWAGKERGQVKLLMEKYGGPITRLALDYVVSYWDDIRNRFFKGKGGVPSIGFLLKFHDVIVIEAQRRSEWLKVKEDWERWHTQNPSSPYPPPELEAQFQRCKRDVEGLGLPT